MCHANNLDLNGCGQECKKRGFVLRWCSVLLRNCGLQVSTSKICAFPDCKRHPFEAGRGRVFMAATRPNDPILNFEQACMVAWLA